MKRTRDRAAARARRRRPRAWQTDADLWHIGQVPETWSVAGCDETHPARRCAVFLVHGIGRQERTVTGGGLRSGFEDALEKILEWQARSLPEGRTSLPETLPAPFVLEGYWADYPDVEATFAEDWARFHEREQEFFRRLWQRHTSSTWRTARWLLGHQLRLLDPRVVREIGWSAWLLYIPLQLIGASALALALFRRPRLVGQVIADVRLYTSPRGAIERAIAQRIDYRVGAAFLRLIGLDWEFRSLPESQRQVACGEPIRFERVTWVAHSLGTVISYNVLSDLFHRAEELEREGDAEQRRGVVRFRASLARFVTLGSPLDKIAFLFGEKTLRPWPRGDRARWLEGGEPRPPGRRRAVARVTGEPPADDEREWWVNFYHVLDPVSEPLDAELVCGDHPPLNLHLRSSLLPGLAHVAYWRDQRFLRFVMARTYGTRYLRDQDYHPWPSGLRTLVATLSYLLWTVVIFGGTAGALWTVWAWGPELLEAVLGGVKRYWEAL